jgi:type IV pilus modification protein PilV
LTSQPARGFTLIEALVALVILLTGIAGSAALLLQTVRQERESGTRRTVLRLVTSMADQLRAVRRPDDRPVLAATGVQPATACTGHPQSCAAEEAASLLRAAWLAEVTSALPRGAAASIVVPDPSRPEYLLTIEWPTTGDGTRRLEMLVKT